MLSVIVTVYVRQSLTLSCNVTGTEESATLLFSFNTLVVATVS